MIVKAIYHGLQQIFKIYRNGVLIFQNAPIEFHLIEDGKLIILGALSAQQNSDGVYLDCEPDWIAPDLENNVLTVEQVYAATLNGTVLEVE